uniref:Putative sodium/glutamate symporter n=1 Tax=Pseudomonas extremaustralis TaxID=359110 RepID=A0AEG3_9PSED|nr:putative sodium/glutamate symporter [Pseudomonas extremaustralis 14-3]
MLDVRLTTTSADFCTPIGHYNILCAWMRMNMTLMLHHCFNLLLLNSGITLPSFVRCLMAGIVLPNLLGADIRCLLITRCNGPGRGMALISNIGLGLFLVMALMGLQLSTLGGVLVFLGTPLTLQITLTILYTGLLGFPCMGRNYEASVIAAGFGGIALGSTATAIVNMTAVTQRYGAAHQAFIIVPLVCGFFIDIVNALIISLMSGI